MRFYIGKWDEDKRTGEVISFVKEVSILHWLWYKFVTKLDLDINTRYVWGK